MSVVHKPITPGEAKRRHFAEFVPDEIYEVIDDLLAERYGTSIKITQKEVIAKALEKMQMDGTSVPQEDFFTNHWLDIESAYEAQGWSVKYRSPDYGEMSFDAYWLFSVSE